MFFCKVVPWSFTLILYIALAMIVIEIIITIAYIFWQPIAWIMRITWEMDY